MSEMLSKSAETAVHMAEAMDNGTPARPGENPERWKNLIVVLTIINTVIVAIIAGLQADAGIRASAANRDSQYYATLASGELVRQGLQSSYDFATFARVIQHTQESLIMQFSALSLQSNGTNDTAATTLQALVAQARADQALAFSIFYNDPRYAPTSDGDVPALQQYIDDQAAIANAIVEKQNAASDDYHKWNKKGDGYLAVLTVLAVAFFLLGLGQSVNRPRLRLFFAICGALIMLICTAWSALVLIV
jgi:hypothetical protein